MMNSKSDVDLKIQSQFQKRLGTLNWLNDSNPYNQWKQAYDLNPEDYQTSVCLAIYYWEVYLIYEFHY